MEVPKVNLVDGIGRRIGTFAEDKDWWQKIKKEQLACLGPMPGLVPVASHQQLRMEAATPRANASDMEVNDLTGDLTQSKAEFIKNNLNTSQKKDVKMSLTADLTDAERLEKEKEAMQKLRNNCKQIGETPLHVAIMHNDLRTVKFLIEEKGIDVNQRTCQGEFQNGFSKNSKQFEKSEYTKMAYYGEYPLCLAACFASKEIYDYLIEHGADPDLYG